MVTEQRRTEAIESGKIYPLETFKRISGLKNHAIRQARRAGLRVRRKHGRAFVLGDEFISYIRGDAAGSPQDASGSEG